MLPETGSVLGNTLVFYFRIVGNPYLRITSCSFLFGSNLSALPCGPRLVGKHPGRHDEGPYSIGTVNAGIGLPVPTTCSTGPTRKSQEIVPASAMPVNMAKGQEDWPVRSKTSPVTAGATIPARLPTKFWKPVHRPAACGPASVCVIAQRLEAEAPKKITPNKSIAMQRTGPLTADQNRRQLACKSLTRWRRGWHDEGVILSASENFCKVIL
jgi:hypothetical protein